MDRAQLLAELLDEELLQRFRFRAAEADRENRFFDEDLAELAELGYLAAFAQPGASLQAVVRAQRRLATAAPATALAVNMHLVWTGVAKLLKDRGDDSLQFVLDEASAGEIFAFGNSETGNDSVLFDSTTVAEPTGRGGYRFTGKKIFTSLSPAWTRLGVFGKDSSGTEPVLVHGFIDRGQPGYSIADDWDTLGMRASQSNSTVLDGVEIPAARIFRELPVGPNADPLIFAIFANFEILLAAVYAGIGERAVTLAAEAAKRRRSLKNDAPAASDPLIRARVAKAAMLMDGIYPQIDVLAAEVDGQADHGTQWFAKLVGLKIRSTAAAREVVDLAIQVNGGASYFTGNELGRLYRDVLAGQFHPSSEDSALGTIATAWLGPVPDPAGESD
ncbi:acyl-CoA dehydrogenase family protein [Arthrobacter russicus]|uniref:Alkylation response protein AidB-like acyl-CoA dehydrogenase n=1 Tax=Arthrobacter russicus TaxID=172040 RepID=A0ABU1J5W9_9MICC|nr:acyl-CoA dehydrogenase family protein [Arthrobacter russicus]MDR6267822.1 alkylation response protein AidB-like acyl-CoA dehydrogenase [Arthrobacter russicus]